MLPNEPARLPLAQLPTPLQPLDRLSEMLGGPRIWLKRDDLTETVLTGNKIRKLEFLVADAKAKKADVLVTCGGIQSNHCRTTAFVAAKLQMKCHLILRGQKPELADGNLLLDKLSGADITFHSPKDWQNLEQIFDRVAQAYLQKGFSPYLIPTGASNGVGLWGYIRGAAELREDCRKVSMAPDLVCVATGSGGTHLGLSVGFQALAPEVSVRGFAVCDSKQYFLQKAETDLAEWRRLYRADSLLSTNIDVVDDYIGPGYGVAQPGVFDLIAQVARTEGVLFDPVYTGKAFYGLVQQIKSGELAGMRNVVFVHTGGVFGVFPFRESFSHQ